MNGACHVITEGNSVVDRKGNRVVYCRRNNEHGDSKMFFTTEKYKMPCRIKQQHFHENKKMINIRTAVDIIQGVAVFMVFKDTGCCSVHEERLYI